jgi:hypothetical protein
MTRDRTPCRPEHRRVSRTVSHLSTAQELGIELLDDDASEHLIVPRNDWRSVRGFVVHRADLPPGDIVVVAGREMTTALRTVLDLARSLDPCGGLVCADSALRQRLIEVGEFRARAAAALGPGAARVRRVGRLADARSGSVAETTTATTAQLDGWLVLQFTWFDLRRRPAYVVATVRRALAVRPS